MLKKFPLLLVIIGFSAQAQFFDPFGSIDFQSQISSHSESPFWFHSNKRGRIDEKTNFAAWVKAGLQHHFNENSILEIGAAGLYQDGYADELQLDEAYVSFKNSWLLASVGRKQRPELFRGLSASNESILWSLNARPMPGISLSTNGTLYLWKEGGIGVQATIEEFLMGKDRYVENTRVHHKSFYLIYSGIKKFQIRVGMQHVVQWAGTSPEHGKLPSDFDAYWRIFTGKGINGLENDDIVDQERNALGNHIGSYEAYLTAFINNYKFELFWNHLFEDGSGKVFRNTPDGRYGLYVEDSQQIKWINSAMYEFYYTRNQSRRSPSSDGLDNYFNNNLYRSGWTYKNRILGTPFFGLDSDRFRVNNNQFIVHHLGIGGMAFLKYPYKLLTSYRKNYGAKGTSFQQEDVFSTYLDVMVWDSYVDLGIQIGSDFSTLASPNFALGIHLSKKLF